MQLAWLSLPGSVLELAPDQDLVEIMPSAMENVALLVGGAVATTALSSAFVASGPVAQEAKTGLRAAGYAKSSQSSSQSMGAMAGVGAVAGLAVAGVAGRRAGKNRTSMEAVGVGINGFGRIGRQVARIAMKDPETDLKLINASYDSDYLAYMMKYDTIHGKYDGTVEADGDSPWWLMVRRLLCPTLVTQLRSLSVSTVPSMFASPRVFS